MWKGMIRTAAATVAFGALHSLLASRPAKDAVIRIAGQRNRDGLYRVAFIGQSLAAFGLLAAYVSRQPNRTLYDVHGPLRVLLRAGQAGGILFAVAGARHVGIARITGLRSLSEWTTGGDVRPEPEAQGPSPDSEGRLQISGPFQLARHPLNLSPLPAFWLTPRMTTNRLAFNLVGTAYLVVGSLHEEYRLRQAYGEDYERYQDSGVPYYLPAVGASRTPSNLPSDGEAPRRGETPLSMV